MPLPRFVKPLVDRATIIKKSAVRRYEHGNHEKTLRRLAAAYTLSTEVVVIGGINVLPR